MKSLGKKTVRHQSFIDGALRKTWNDNRVVYESSGGYYINDLGSKRKIAVNANGEYEAMHNAKTINCTQDINDIFKKMGLTRYR